MYNLNDAIKGGTMCLGCAALQVDAGTTTDAETEANFAFAIDGKCYAFTSDNGDVPFESTETVTALHTALFLVVTDAAGTCTMIRSNEVLTADYDAGRAVLHWPTPTADTCPIGAIKIVATAAFTGGTTALGTGNAATYYNLMTVPSEPMNCDND